MKSSQWHNSDTSASWKLWWQWQGFRFRLLFSILCAFHIKNIFLFFALFPFIVFALSGWNAFNFSCSCSFFLIFLMHLCSRCNFRKWKWRNALHLISLMFLLCCKKWIEIDKTGIILIVGLYKKRVVMI